MRTEYSGFLRDLIRVDVDIANMFSRAVSRNITCTNQKHCMTTQVLFDVCKDDIMTT